MREAGEAFARDQRLQGASEEAQPTFIGGQMSRQLRVNGARLHMNGDPWGNIPGVLPAHPHRKVQL